MEFSENDNLIQRIEIKKVCRNKSLSFLDIRDFESSEGISVGPQNRSNYLGAELGVEAIGL